MSTILLSSTSCDVRRFAGIGAFALLAALFSGIPPTALAQSFNSWQNLTGVRWGDAVWGDFDADGDLDLVYGGQTQAGNRLTHTYENQGGLLVFRQELIGVSSETSHNLAWGDYDGDGDLDLAMAGWTNNGTRITRIYQNDGSGNLTWDTAQVLTEVGQASVAWGDYDNDGDLDLVAAGWDSAWHTVTVLYKNDPLGTLAPDPTVLLKGLAVGSADWADYDGDGDVDLLLTGRDARYNWTSWTVFYENDPVGTLTDTGSHGLPGVSYAPDAAWGDYDNDGDLDLAFLGSTGSSAVGRIYKNDGGGTLTQVAQPLHIFAGCSAWGDYDNDGDLDVAFTGATHPPYVDHTKIYENTGSGFAQAFSFFGLCNSSVSWADVDQDCDLDFLFAGNNHAFEYHAGLYKSLGGAPNTAPSAPTECQGVWTEGDLRLSWSGATDAQTSTAGLYYCLRVGTTPGAHDVVSGTYGTPLMGNVGQATEMVLNVPAATYYWSVQAIDSGFMASPWTEEQVAAVITTEEIVAAQGGTVETPDGQLTLEVEPDDLAEDTTISVTETVPQDPEKDLMIGLNPGLGQAIAVYDLEPDGQTFASPVTLTIHVDLTALNPNQRDRLTLYRFEDTNNDGIEDAFVPIAGTVCTIVEDPPESGTFIATCTAGVDHFCDFAVLAPLDSDEDGLPDLFPVAEGAPPYDEAAYGTHPLNSDTDGDGLLDGTEVDVALGNESDCPDPLNADSDGDSLSDGEEVSLDTNECNPDTDGDGVPDNVDPEPTVPGETTGVLEDACRQQAGNVQGLDLSVFNGPNDNANSGRRNALANRATDAANAIAQGDTEGAIESLTSLLQKIDGESPPPDWMADSPEKTALAAEVSLLIALLEYEL